MSLSALDIIDRKARQALARLKADAFREHVSMTLVVRVAGDEDAFIVITDDDLDEVIEVLKKESP